MQLMKWNPRKDVLSVRNRINSLFDDFFYPSVWEDFHSSLSDWNPTVDIYENDDQIVVKADLPGVEKKDIHVDVKNNMLTIKGERSSESESKKQNFYHRERALGKFERSLTLPSKVDTEKINASYKDGVLKIEIPKPESQKPKHITVQ